MDGDTTFQRIRCRQAQPAGPHSWPDHESNPQGRASELMASGVLLAAATVVPTKSAQTSLEVAPTHRVVAWAWQGAAMCRTCTTSPFFTHSPVALVQPGPSLMRNG